MLAAPAFLIAGLALALGPVLIHLLNRRRFRSIEWAAMDFLREAVQRTRRMYRLRDLLLLVVRTAALALLGLALARPYLSRPAQATSADQPVHGVVLLDNSLSMSYQQLDGTLFDAAKKRAKAWIERLASGSRVTIVPLCGSSQGVTTSPYPSREDAIEAFSGLEVADRAASAPAALDLALEACNRVPELAAKRIVLVGDTQVTRVPREAVAAQLGRLPVALEVIEVTAADAANAWVADFRLQDDIADLQSPAHFFATVGYDGPAPRSNVQATLLIDGAAVSSATVDLAPGQRREVRFPPYQFDVTADPNRATFVAAEVRLTPDRLPGDDARFLAVPVVSALPVVFVDQYGASENPSQSRYGETYSLRRLLAPVTGDSNSARQLVAVRHLRVDELTREVLGDARLVIMAGVADPVKAVPVLREYLLQGGTVLVAAGDEFDPIAWTQTAWLDGAGILPCPLRPEFVGRLIDDPAGPATPFQIDTASLVHDWFVIDTAPREELDDLYRLAYYFKAATADLREESLAPLRKPIDATTTARWLTWAGALGAADAAAEAKPAMPRVLAQFTNRLPYVIDRPIGRGRAVLLTSGFSPRWTTLSLTNTMLVFDRITRDILRRTFPQRTLTTDDTLTVPVVAAERSARWSLVDSQGRERALNVEAQGPDRYGVSIARVSKRGIYRLVAQTGEPGAAGGRLVDQALAINGPADESMLRPRDLPVTEKEASGRPLESPLAAINLWKLVLAAVLALLVFEIGLLAAPAWRRSTTPGAS